MALAKFALRRILLLIPTLIGVSIVTFILVRVLPGDPIASILGQAAGQEEIAAARTRYGLDKPLLTQYFNFMSGLVRGDLGVSIQSGQPVRTEILERLGPTLELIVIAVAVALALAVVLGLYAAMRVNRPQDVLVRVGSLIGNSMPDFWVGLLLILFFYAGLGWAPAPSGRVANDAGLRVVTGSGIVDSIVTGNFGALGSVLAHLALPVLTLVVSITAPLLRSVRASALEVRRSEAYAVARAHGISGWRLLRGYLLRPTLARLPALAALVFGFALGSAVIVEQLFAWQGLGQWTLRGVLYRDYPVVQTAVIVMATFYTLIFAVADVVQAIFDPRVRLR